MCVCVCVKCVFNMTSPTAVYNLPIHSLTLFSYSIFCTMEQKSRNCHSLPTVQSKPSLFLGRTLPQEVPSPKHASCAAVLIMGHYERQRHSNATTYSIWAIVHICRIKVPCCAQVLLYGSIESNAPDSETTSCTAYDFSSNYGTKPGPGDG